MSASDAPWVVLRREDLEDLLDRAVARGRELANESTWMQIEQVAQLLGVTRETVINYTNRDKLPCRYAGKTPVFRRDEVVAWLDARKTRPGAVAPRDKLRPIRGGRGA